MHTALYTCDDVNDIGGGDAANDARSKYRFVVLRALGRNVDDDYDEMRMQRNAMQCNTQTNETEKKKTRKKLSIYRTGREGIYGRKRKETTRGNSERT